MKLIIALSPLAPGLITYGGLALIHLGFGVKVHPALAYTVGYAAGLACAVISMSLRR